MPECELIEEELDDELFIDEIHIWYENIDRSYLHQVKDEQSHRIIK